MRLEMKVGELENTFLLPTTNFSYFPFQINWRSWKNPYSKFPLQKIQNKKMVSFGNFFFQCILLLLASAACVSAKVVEHEFQVENIVVNRLCKEQVIVGVNGKYPGPTIYAQEGDTILIHVFNKSPYNITIHWHGVQLLPSWADGANFITQCPILPGDSYTYNFNITKQEGTLWWHAHVSWLRATVHGALIIYPRDGHQYPFKKPDEEIPIILGEWYTDNVVDLANQYLHVSKHAGLAPALTINGQPGDFNECSSKDMYKLKVRQGKTYLLRIINAGLNNEQFYSIANHRMTVVAVDACYTVPYVTDFVYIAPGQSIDVLLEVDQPPASYYMMAYLHVSRQAVGYQTKNLTASGVLIYEEEADQRPSTSQKSPILAKGPDFFDITAVRNFTASLRGLTEGPFWVPVPEKVDQNMFVVVGTGELPCQGEMGVCTGRLGGIVYFSMNNISFELPTKMSVLEAFHRNIDGVYTADFPNEPPVKFDYTNMENIANETLLPIGEVATRVKKLRYNETVQIVFQNTALFNPETHPVHLHGFNFHVVGEGLGNYDPVRDEPKFNLVNPQMRSTISVTALGWIAIRFQANNPGAWMMHCHLDYHHIVGLATVFLVEDGPSPSTSLPPPPFDFPKCDGRRNNNNSIDGDQVVRLPVGKSSMLDGLE